MLVQLKRIGDVILTTPALIALRAHFPAAHLTVAIDANAAGLAGALPADEILVRRPGDLGFWQKAVTGGFDVTLDFTGNDRSALVSVLSRAPRRLTYERFAKKPLRRWIYTDFVDSSVRDRHTADHHTDLLGPLGINAANVPSQLDLPASAHAEAEEALADHGIDGEFTIFHPGTARPEKYWPDENWAELIGRVPGPLVLTGSADPTEQSHLTRILKRLTPDHQKRSPAFLAGKLTLAGTAALIERAALVIAVDSAPVHLADALGTPVIALFGPTNPHHWCPRGPKATVIHPSNEITPRTPRHPMSDLTVESVVQACAAKAESLRALAASRDPQRGLDSG
ncbi:MAG: glycosyltransferase family 9 protein [Chthoniobacterales bacterium]